MDRRRPRAEAMAVREGRIVAVGEWEEVEPYAAGAQTLDLKQRAVLPGLIDTHAHFLWTALSLAALDVSGAEDHESLQATVREAAADIPPGEVILGMGFTEYALKDTRGGPILAALDQVASENPVLLMGVTGHTAAINSKGLEVLDLPEGTPGVLCDAQGNPTGLLADRANSLAGEWFSRAFGADEKSAAMVELAVQKAHSVGLTTVHVLEGGLTSDDDAVEELLRAIPDLPLRLVLYYQTMDVERVLELGLPRIGGCILLDGDVGPHTAALSEPYVDQPDCYGTLYHTQEEIDGFVLRAHRAGLQVAMHAVGDAAVEQALNAYEAALSAYPRDDHRHRIEHCEVIREEQVQRAQRLGVALAIQPPFNYYWDHGTFYPTLGYERAWKVDPVRTLVRPGLLVAGGSDSTVTPLGPLIGVHAAANHSNPAERVSVYEGLQLYTVNAARIAFEEQEKGSLEVGKLGDFVVLAEDPLTIDPRCIDQIAVDMTVVGGEVVYERA